MNKQDLLRAKAQAPFAITTLITQWDTLVIIEDQIEYLLEEDEDTKAKLTALTAELGDADKAKAQLKDTLFNEVNADSFIFDQAHEDLCNDLSEFMEKLNKGSYWKATVSNFGWRNQSGHKFFEATDGQKLLRQVLPDCECTYRIFRVKGGRAIAIQNFHHDSPVGNEWYLIKPCSATTYEKYR